MPVLNQNLATKAIILPPEGQKVAWQKLSYLKIILFLLKEC